MRTGICNSAIQIAGDAPAGEKTATITFSAAKS